MEYKSSYVFDIEHLIDIFRLSDVQGLMESVHKKIGSEFVFLFDFDGLPVVVHVSQSEFKNFFVYLAKNSDLKSL